MKAAPCPALWRECVPGAWLIGLFAMLWAASAGAQNLAPRTFWPAPVGTKVLAAGYAHAAGDVLVDPSLPVYGVDSRIHNALLAYLQTFDLGGRTANVLFELPYSDGTTRGIVETGPTRRDFSGFNDIGVTLMINLLGAPAMSPADMQALRANPRPIVGVSVKLLAPTGAYDDERLINVGGNRWATHVKLGAIIPLRPLWLLELEAGAWFLGDDDDYLTGRREQEPIYALEAHLIRRFKPGFWASLEANWYTGGRQTIGGNELVDLKSNSRIGATVVVPFAGRNALKLGYSVSMRTRYGGDSNQLLVAWQHLLK